MCRLGSLELLLIVNPFLILFVVSSGIYATDLVQTRASDLQQACEYLISSEDWQVMQSMEAYEDCKQLHTGFDPRNPYVRIVYLKLFIMIPRPFPLFILFFFCSLALWMRTVTPPSSVTSVLGSAWFLPK